MPRITRRKASPATADSIPADLSPVAAEQLRRADRALATARIDLESGDADGAASRAYYAAFHAATALFLQEGKSFKSHSGLEQAIHRDLIQSGRWREELGHRYKYLHNLRATANYGGMRHVSAEEADQTIQYAQSIVDEVRRSLC